MARGPEFSDAPESLSDSELLACIHQLRMSAADAHLQIGHEALENWVHMGERYAIEARRRGFELIQE